MCREIKDFGFKNLQELHQLVSSLDLSVSGAIEKFKKWQTTNGTKDELVKLKIQLEEKRKK